MLMELKELDSEIETLKKKHTNDKDLDHVIGKDSDCFYCEQFKKLSREQKRLQTQSTKELKKNKILLEPIKTATEKNLYEIVISDGSKFMIFAESIDEIARLLKLSVSKIKKETIVPKKYWGGMYIETANGSLKTVKQMINSKRSRIISSYTISKNKNVRHYCYNNTPFEYLVYDETNFERLERFINPYTLIKTKKFGLNGRVNIQTPTGSIGVNHGEVLMKITEKVMIALEKDDFYQNFSEEENYVWIANE